MKQSARVARAEREHIAAVEKHGLGSREAKRTEAVAEKARQNATLDDLREADDLRYQDRLR